MGRDSYGVDINLTAAFHAGNEGMIPEKKHYCASPIPLFPSIPCVNRTSKFIKQCHKPSPKSPYICICIYIYICSPFPVMGGLCHCLNPVSNGLHFTTAEAQRSLRPIRAEANPPATADWRPAMYCSLPVAPGGSRLQGQAKKKGYRDIDVCMYVCIYIYVYIMFIYHQVYIKIYI